MDFNGLNRCSRFYSFINSQTSLTPKNLEPRILVDSLTRRLADFQRPILGLGIWGGCRLGGLLRGRGERRRFAVRRRESQRHLGF